MKTRTFLSMLAFPLAALTSNDYSPVAVANTLGAEAVTALRNGSIKQFEGLFPTLAEFQKLMDENSGIYKENIEVAKEEFAGTYVNMLMPELQESFHSLLMEGGKRGINWSDVKLSKARLGAADIPAAGHTTLTVTIVSNDKEHNIEFSRVMRIGTRWYTGYEAKFQ